MSFGVQCASNVAQGWAHLLMHLVRSTMDAMEQAASSTLTLVETIWIQTRKAVFTDPTQWRLYYAEMFTDDMAAAVVGEDRCVRYLLAWHETITSFNIIMAPPKKRQIGYVLHWIGGILLAIGLVTMALQKRIRAIHSLKVLLAGKLT